MKFSPEPRKSRFKVARFFSFKKWGLCISLALVIWMAWSLIWNRDLLNTPLEVTQSEKKYLAILANYQKDPELWIDRKNQVLHIMKRYGRDDKTPSRGLDFNHIPLEIFLAFLDDDLNFFKLFSSEVSLFPNVYKDHTSFFLVKKQSRLFFFSSYVTLAIDLRFEGPRLRTDWVGAFQGQRRVPVEEGLNSFSRELLALKGLEEYSNGMKTLHWEAGKKAEGNTEAAALFSFEYLKKGLF